MGNIVLLIFISLLIGSFATDTNIDIGSIGNYDYGKVLHASLLFYEAQRQGKLPANNRISWRGDSFLGDKGDNGEDLTGGYSDAGDFIKFGFPLAYALTMVGWGVIDYEDAFTAAGELENARDAIKWGTDWILKAHVKDRVLYAQVSDSPTDHYRWDSPENWPSSVKRPVYKITESEPGSDLAAETAAALAAASIVFKKSNASYSNTLLSHAKTLYDFAFEKRGKYSDHIKDQYGSNGYGDELGWASLWVFRASGERRFKGDFDKHWNEFKLYEFSAEMSWNVKTPALQVLAAKLFEAEVYFNVTQTYCDYVVNKATKTPKGLVMLHEEWGTLRHAGEASFLCLQAAELGINTAEYRAFAKKQIGYALGDTGRSFVVGVGTNPPTHPHHRAASCPGAGTPCGDYKTRNESNAHVLTGALVGGPDKADKYEDIRDDYVHNEVALDYNAGFQSAVAALAHLKSLKLLP